jgi:hypothetical protein
LSAHCCSSRNSISLIFICSILGDGGDKGGNGTAAFLMAGIDRYERNRSRFISGAPRHELKRRMRKELQCSLDHPRPDSITTASLGLPS